MHVLSKIGVAAGVIAASVASIALALPASADTAAVGGDAVVVGSDTVQNAADFAFDGSPGVAGGFNTAGNANRAVNIFATGDANGRLPYDGTCGPADTTGIAQFCDATNKLAPNALAGSVILRAGTKPVIRPNGSGAGVAALISDSPGGTGYKGLPTGSIQFARMSRLPNSTEIGNCNANAAGCGALHVYQIATDTLTMVHQASAYNGPSALSSQDLVDIYTCAKTTWNQLPGNSGGSTSTIHPLIPQSGSGTRNFFLQQITVDTGGSASAPITPGSCVRTVQEHDPTGIYADSSSADAIEPFSTGKLAMINGGYFANGVGYSGTGAANGAYTPNYLAITSGTADGNGTANFSTVRGMYVVARQTDVTSTAPFEPGFSANAVSTLITSPVSAFRSANGRSEIAQAGFTAAFKDCLTNPTTC